MNKKYNYYKIIVQTKILIIFINFILQLFISENSKNIQNNNNSYVFLFTNYT